MELTTFDSELSTNRTLDAGGRLPEIHASSPGDRARAVADLIQNKFLSHTFGVQGEWEARTTLIISRQAWRYQSSVFVHGKEIGKGFSRIDVDRTRQIRQAKAVSEEVLAAFAREAVEVHFTRCANITEYLLRASIYSQPLLRYHGIKKVALVVFSVAVLLTAYGLWRGSNGVGPEQPHAKPVPQSIQWQVLQVSYSYPAGEPFVFPLPTLERTPDGMPVEVTLEASGDEPGWLQLDRKGLYIRGTAPRTAEDQTYLLILRAHAEQGSDSRLLVLLTINGQPDRMIPAPQLPGHWTW